MIIIGGGAAGFFCAVNLARLNPSLKVILLEKTTKLLSKVKVSGGGRCNVTHDCDSISTMIKKYPRGGNFLKKSFTKHFVSDTITWFSTRGVPLHVEADGRVFPVSNSSQSVIDCLLSEASRYGVDIRMNADVERIEVIPGAGFTVILKNQQDIQADKICISAGGKPKLEGFSWLKSLEHQIITPVPSLFTFNMPGNVITKLMGISVEHVVIKLVGSKLQTSGPLLITHWGMSGPAVLKMSAWAARELATCAYNYKVVINWLPDFHETSLLEKFRQLRSEISNQKIINRNPFALPARLWEHFLAVNDIKEEWRWADLPAKNQNALIKTLCSAIYDVQGKTTFKEEFVTAGGVDTAEIDPLTMESRLHKNLFFAGEIINVDGVTGGFNFQNAWTTGFLAASAMAEATAT